MNRKLSVAQRAESDDGFREAGQALIWAVLICAPILASGGWMIHRSAQERESVRLAAIEATLNYEKMVAAPAGPMVAVADAARGRDLFQTTCTACHGPEAKGITGLGMNLVQSDFVAGADDVRLATFIENGRMNARPVPMPPKGGHPELSDTDIRQIVVYLRGVQDPRRMPDLPAPVVASVVPTAKEQEQALAVAGGDVELAGFIASGTKLYARTCIACHGPGGQGIKGNGKVLARNDFVKGLDDDQLLAFIKRGRDPGDPRNTTGVAMPPKGGNPALKDDDLLDIIAFVRTLQSEGVAQGN